ncbi:hypothetical protein KAOT1_00500 [Kordia algicida OT-1]|uniref:Uncharacterized protein n=2 Tax=Kordia TaxID=221065 RepID=A9E9W0_9FLAO|nr:hypothetical protein KAOT1_00500 [Kordia algicida OT-1]
MVLFFIFTVNNLNATVNDFEADVTNYETPCEAYAQRAATSESFAYGGQSGYTDEEYFNAYVDYLNYCSYDVWNESSSGAVPAQPVFL